MTRTNTIPHGRELYADQRGAVMLTGLFMAFCLIGALWYVIGIGEALIFRDRMQEAADSAAFTAAVLNAKGMNFISVCNIFALLLVTVYLVFAVIQDATILTCLACAFSCVVCCAACPRIPGAIRMNQNTAKAVKRGLNFITALESGAAIGYPWMGTLRANTVGKEYVMRENQNSRAGDKSQQANVWAMGMSNVPALGGGFAGNVPLGLPVEGKAYSKLCKKVGTDLVGWLSGLIFGESSLKKLGNAVGKLVGSFVEMRYCNDLSWSGPAFDQMLGDVRGNLREAEEELRTGQRQTDAQNSQVPEGGQLSLGLENQRPDLADQIDPDAPFDTRSGDGWQGWSPWFDPGFDKGWGDKGYLVPHPSAGNGRQPHQIWAINMNPRYNDDNQKKVSYGARTRAQNFDSDQQEVGPQGWGYFSQAEFYFDCDDRWSGDDCNGGDNAAFSVRWRARLRRVQGFSMMQVLQQFLFNGFSDRITGAVRGAIDGAIGRWVPGGDVFRQSNFGVATIDMVAGQINSNVVEPLLEMAQGQLDRISESIMPTSIGGAYH